jgi:hypothetical protein
VANPGKPPGSRSTGLLDVCTARRMWPDGTYSVRKKILVGSEAFGSDAMNGVYTFRLLALTVVCTTDGETSNPLHEVAVLRNVNCDHACYSSAQIACSISYVYVWMLKACYTRCSCSPASSSDSFSGFCILVSVVEDSIFQYSDFTGVACERELIQLEWPH